MAEVGIGIHRVIQDVDGESATVTSGKLDVNATIQAGDLNVGNVDIHLNGGVPLLAVVASHAHPAPRGARGAHRHLRGDAGARVLH